MLVALDQVTALVNPTGYYDAYSRLIWPEAFVGQRELLELVRGERKLARGVLLTTAGFEDVLEITRHFRRDVYGLAPDPFKAWRGTSSSLSYSPIA